MNDKTLRIISTISLVFLIAILAMIFIFSSESGEKSSETSGRITDIAINIFIKDYDELPSDRQQEIRSKTEHIIRKLAHFTEFMILGFILMVHVYSIMEYKKMKTIFSLLYVSLFGILYAVFDECHQMFSVNRGPAVKDVLIDSSGVITGVIISFLLLTLIKNIIIKKNSKGRI